MCLNLGGFFGGRSAGTSSKPSFCICKLRPINPTKLPVFQKLVEEFGAIKEIRTQQSLNDLFSEINDLLFFDLSRDECKSDYEYYVKLQVSAVHRSLEDHPALFEEMTLNHLETMHCVIHNCRSLDFRQEKKYFKIDKSPSNELQSIIKEFACEFHFLCDPYGASLDEDRLVTEIKELKVLLKPKERQFHMFKDQDKYHDPMIARMKKEVETIQLEVEEKELALAALRKVKETRRNEILASQEILFQEDGTPDEIQEAKEAAVKTRARIGTEISKNESLAKMSFFKKELNYFKQTPIQATVNFADLRKLPVIAYFRLLLSTVKQRRARNLIESFATAKEFHRYLNNYLFLKQYNELFPEKKQLLLDHIKVLKRDKKPLRPDAPPFPKYLAQLYQQKIYLWSNYEFVLMEFETVQFMQYLALFKQALQTLTMVCECKLLLSAIELGQPDLIDVRIGYLLYLFDSKMIEDPKIKFILSNMKGKLDTELILQLKRQVQTIEQSNLPPYTNEIGAHVQQQQLVRWLLINMPKLRQEHSQTILEQFSSYNKFNFLPETCSTTSETTLVNDSAKNLPREVDIKQERIQEFYFLTRTPISLILLMNPHNNSGVDQLTTISYEINNLLNSLKQDSLSKSVFLKTIENACNEMKSNIKLNENLHAKHSMNQSYFDRLFDKLKLNLSSTWNGTIHSLSLVYFNYFREPKPNSSVSICIKIINILNEILPQSPSATFSSDLNYFNKIVDTIEVKLSSFAEVLGDDKRNIYESIIFKAANDIVKALKEYRVIFSLLNVHQFILYLNNELPFRVIVPSIFQEFYTIKIRNMKKHFKTIRKVSKNIKQTLDIVQNRYFTPEVEKVLMEYRSELVIFAEELEDSRDSVLFRIFYSSKGKPKLVKELGHKIEYLMLKNTKLDIDGGIKNLEVLNHTLAEKEQQKRLLDHQISINKRQNIVSVFNYNLFSKKITVKTQELEKIEKKIHFLNAVTGLAAVSTDKIYTMQVSRIAMMINEDKSLAFGFNNFALKYASQFGHIDLAKELLKYENVVSQLQSNQRSDNINLSFEPLQLATMNSHLEILSMLLKYCAPAPSTIIWAAEQQFWDAVKILLVDKRIHANILNNTLIILASKDGRIDVVEYLTRDDAVDPAAQENSAFIQASGGGHLNVMQFLLKFKCVVPNSQDNRAIQLAAKNGKSKAVKFLLQIEKVNPTANNNEAIKLAAENGHANTVEILLCDPRVEPNIENGILIHNCCHNGLVRVLQVLINDKRTIIPFSDKGNFVIAVNLGKEQLLTYLQNINYKVNLKKYEIGVQDHFLSEDGNLEINFKPPQLKITPVPDDEEFVDAIENAVPCKSYGEMLNCYSQNGRASLVELILQDDNPYLSSKGCNALIIACQNGYLSIVESLLKDGRFDPSLDGNIALILACKNGHAEVVELLLQDSRVDPAVNNNSPIMFAARNGHLGVVELLLKNPRVDPSDNDNSAMTLARDAGYKDVVQSLLNNPKVALLAAFESQDQDKITALVSSADFAPQFKNNYAIRMASTNGYVSIVESLLGDKRVNPAANGNQALLGAIKNGHERIVEMLLNDFRVNISNQERLIFKTCCEYNRVKILYQMMNDKRFNPEDVVSEGLLAATMRGNLEIVDALLSKADYLKAVKAGNIFSTVFKFAKSKNNKGIINALTKLK
ncbi:hypothetical protein HDV06_002940 [Boothiomyces sp. JEL0866]|nr:hypothetical protein HDV06_002940 [Boothiomyces sp. JEL0866]